MTIFYTQVLQLNNYKILTCSFSSHGESIQSNITLLAELRKAIEEIPNKSEIKIYNFRPSSNNKYMFYIKIIHDLAISIIADSCNSAETANMYISKVEEVLNEININDRKSLFELENFLKGESNNFNKNSDFFQADIELTKTRNVCVESLNKIIQRGEKIDRLADLSEELKAASKIYNTRSRNMYYTEKAKEYSIYMAVFMIMFLFLYFCFIR